VPSFRRIASRRANDMKSRAAKPFRVRAQHTALYFADQAGAPAMIGQIVFIKIWHHAVHQARLGVANP
jgi:hypothetical protein